MSSAAHVPGAASQKEIDEWLSRIDEINSAISEYLHADIDEENERKRVRDEKRKEEAKRLAKERIADRYDPNRYKRFEDDKLIDKMLAECDEPPKPKHQSLTDLSKFEKVTLREAEACKASGNEELRKGNFAKAEEYYSNAIGMNPMDEDLMIILHNNRAQANILLGSYSNAVSDTSFVLMRQRHNSKALLRRSKALLHLHRPREALRDIKTLLIAEPKNIEGLKMMARAEDEMLEISIVENDLRSNSDLNLETPSLVDGEVRPTKGNNSTYQELEEHCHTLKDLVWKLLHVLEEKEVPYTETPINNITLEEGQVTSSCTVVSERTVQLATDDDIDAVLQNIVVSLYCTAKLLGCDESSVGRYNNYGRIVTEDFMGPRVALRIHGGLTAVRDIACLLLLPQKYEMPVVPDSNNAIEKSLSEQKEKGENTVTVTTVFRKRDMLQFKRLPGVTACLMLCMRVIGACYGSSKVARGMLRETITSTVIESDIDRGKPAYITPHIVPMNLVYYSADAVKAVTAGSIAIRGPIGLCTAGASFLAAVVAEESGFGCECVFGGKDGRVAALPLSIFVGALDNIASLLKKARKEVLPTTPDIGVGIASPFSQQNIMLGCFESLLQIVVSLLSNRTAMIRYNSSKKHCRDILDERDYYRTSIIPSCLVALSFHEHTETTQTASDESRINNNNNDSVNKKEKIALFETALSLLLILPTRYYTSTVEGDKKNDTFLEMMKLLVPRALGGFASVCKAAAESVGYLSNNDTASLDILAHSTEAVLSIFYNVIIEEKIGGSHNFPKSDVIIDINNECPLFIPSCLTIVKSCQLSVANDNNDIIQGKVTPYLPKEQLPVITRTLGVLGKALQLSDNAAIEAVAEEHCDNALWRILSYISSAARRTAIQMKEIQKVQSECDMIYGSTNGEENNNNTVNIIHQDGSYHHSASLTSLQRTAKYQDDAVEHISIILCHVYWKMRLRTFTAADNNKNNNNIINNNMSDASNTQMYTGMTGAERLGILLDHLNFKMNIKTGTNTVANKDSSSTYQSVTFETNSVLIGNVALILNTLLITDYITARKLGDKKGTKMVTVASVLTAKSAIKKSLGVIVSMMSAIEEMEKEQRMTLASLVGSKQKEEEEGNINSDYRGGGDGENTATATTTATTVTVTDQSKTIKNTRSALSNIGIMISGWVQNRHPSSSSLVQSTSLNGSDGSALTTTTTTQFMPGSVISEDQPLHCNPSSVLCDELRELRGFEILAAMLKINPNQKQ